MAPSVSGVFYSTNLQASLAWWKSPDNFASKKVLHWIEHGVKVDFKKGFLLRRSLRRRDLWMDPQVVDFEHLKGRRIGAYEDLAQGGEQFLSRSSPTALLHLLQVTNQRTDTT